MLEASRGAVLNKTIQCLFCLCQSYWWESLHSSAICLSLSTRFFPSNFTGKLLLGRKSVCEYFLDTDFLFNNKMLVWKVLFWWKLMLILTDFCHNGLHPTLHASMFGFSTEIDLRGKNWAIILWDTFLDDFVCVGDAVVSNPITWVFTEMNLDLSTPAPADAAKPFQPKPEITHLFRWF